MIRINLLPREEKGSQRRSSSAPMKAGDWLAPAAIVVAAGLVMFGTGLSQQSKQAGLVTSIADVEAQARALAPQIERVNRLAQERAELDLRLGIISKLEKDRTGSVRLMDELARCIPDHLWLSGAMQEGGSQLVVEGSTLSNLVVSDFMSRLERSPLFANVELNVAERGKVGDRPVVKFRVTAAVTPDEPVN
ncbi:MAG: hypothetical protein HOP12_00150 [Candidatus Eisenbacteria bacterium]|uniref:PilN domain-containing protein n=1 Tax=Eiseniibacteriota bacterium TaxID=2212470 RepID=A0A849SJ39_UNCEI|nr:hypothetical protein [Candidatus Eisenbacteria bacterium]